MILAVEDILSDVVVRKIIAVTRPDLMITTSLGLRGKGYLRSKAAELNRTASAVPVLLLIDQDATTSCPPGLVQSWFGSSRQPNMLFRVAVMEVESWILAHRDAFAAFLAIGDERIPANTDEITQPKEFIVNLARRSRSARIREDLVPAPGSTTAVGPAYNLRLTNFVESSWEPARATAASPSLRKAVHRIEAAFR